MRTDTGRHPRRLAARLAAIVAGGAAALLAAGSGVAANPVPEAAVVGAGDSRAVRDSYLVVLHDSAADRAASQRLADRLTRRFGGTVQHTFGSAVAGFSVRMPDRAARRLAAHPLVAYVEQDRQVTSTGRQTSPPWGLDRVDQRSLPLSRGYTYPTAASRVTVYVLDTGLRTGHREFGGRARYGWDAIDGDHTAPDCQGHGTHVAGTAGGATTGVAKGVKIVGVRVLNCKGNGSTAQIVAGVDWVTAHAVRPAVVNMSLAGAASAVMDSAVRTSIASGITYVVAAGNDNANACNTSPARVAEAITVGATDPTDRRATFSNRGSCVDIFAPGTSIPGPSHTSNSATVLMSGTSMASPHVAGAAALVLAARPAATPAKVRQVLLSASSKDKVRSPGSNSPNRLLYVRNFAPPPPPSACRAPVASSTSLRIRDRSTLTRTLLVSGCTGKAAKKTKVTVDIRHPRRGDLAIDLIGPNGRVYPLKAAHPRTTKQAKDVRRTYTVNASTQPRSGQWRLRVRDVRTGNVGYVRSWRIAP